MIMQDVNWTAASFRANAEGFKLLYVLKPSLNKFPFSSSVF